MASHYHRLYATSARQVEATACLLALRWANAISFPSILVITDSELLVRNLRSRKVLDTMVQYTHSDFKLLGSCFDCCKMQKVSRDGVAPAHLLAKAALRNRLMFLASMVALSDFVCFQLSRKKREILQLLVVGGTSEN